MKKPRRIKLTVDPDFGMIAAGEIWNTLKNNYGLWVEVKPVCEFPNDPIETVEVRFFATDVKATEIERYLKATYQFTEE